MTAAIRSTQNPASRLDGFYQQVQAVILERQHPISGLLPASTAVNVHGNYTDAWVRDNVYSILAVWGLALAYRRSGSDPSRCYQLEQSTIRLMRGLLVAMMRQADKVEQFKHTQNPLDALHAKYDTPTGTTVVGDDEWGHLQLDATSLFLLMLAQMTASGLPIVASLDEVNFVQNLIWYISRAYRTPDYGIWERGNKINHGKPELNASSIGMALAALEALNGFDLFGANGSQASVIHVMPDEIARTRLTLRSLLPRESASKEVDGALLSIISFPAFAVADRDLAERTRRKVVTQLEGRHGCKRFLRDGHQAVIEDTSRLHYEPFELQQFEHIECEWPLFFCYLMLDGQFRGDRNQVAYYRDRLRQLAVERDGQLLLPELYFVPEDRIEAERQSPGSQPREANDNLPLVWAQSLWMLGELLAEGLLELGDIDPIGRHLQAQAPRPTTVQIALIAEDEELQTRLADFGITTQTPSQVAPIRIRRGEELAQVFSRVGLNPRLGLQGRPLRRPRSLASARAYQLAGETVVFLPSFLDQRQFYLTLDYHFLIAQFKSELSYVHRNWNQPGRPTLTLLITRTMVETGREALLDLIGELSSGRCNNVPVRIGPLQQLLRTTGVERIDDLHGFRFTDDGLQDTRPRCYVLGHDPKADRPLSGTREFALEVETEADNLVAQLRQSRNLYEQAELLQDLAALQGLDWSTGLGGDDRVRDLLDEVYGRAAERRYWGILRQVAGVLGRTDIGLEDAVTDLVVRQKQIAIGKAYTSASLIVEPLPVSDILEKFTLFCREDIRERTLSQEILLYLNVLVRGEPELFKGFLTLRVGYLILLLTGELAQERQLTQDEAYEQLMQLSPFAIKTRLREAIIGYEDFGRTLQQQESLHLQNSESIRWDLPSQEPEEAPSRGWRFQRQRDGAFNRVPKDFYPLVWSVLRTCRGLVIGDKLERRNRLDSEPLLAEMTPGEKQFALRVEHLLNKIDAPEYRQLTLEALVSLGAFVQANPEVQFEEYIVLDVLIGHAVRLAWLADHPDEEARYEQCKADAWHRFYERSPRACRESLLAAIRFLSVPALSLSA